MSANLYNSKFYDKQSRDSYISAKVVLSCIQNIFCKTKHFNSIIDLGCGVGSWLAAASELGIKTQKGLDGSYVKEEQFLADYKAFIPSDLSKPEEIKLPKSKFDLAISLEVAEHIPQEKSDSFVDLLVTSSDIVLFSAAIPYQGGHGHVNENWLEYWCEKFQKRGYIALDLVRPQIWSAKEVCWWYKQNCILFVNLSKPQLMPDNITYSKPKSLVHPEQFITAVHRVQTQRIYSHNEDLEYWSRCSNNEKVQVANRYGAEYSYTEEDIEEVSSLDELKARLKSEPNDILLDAVSPIKPKDIHFDNISSSNVVHRVPDFLCVGAQKSGTTWLDSLFRGQKELWLPPLKELSFFNNLAFESTSAFSGKWRRTAAFDRLRMALNNNHVMDQKWFEILCHLCKDNADFNWYLEIFNKAPKNRLVGEFTPEYMLLPEETISSIQRINPNLKLIFILRKPSERTESHLRMLSSQGIALSKNCLEELAIAESVRYRSEYNVHLANWRKFFPREQMLILNYSSINSSSEQLKRKLSEFMEIEFDLPTGILNKRVHASKIDCKLPSLFIQDSYRELDGQWEEIEFG